MNYKTTLRAGRLELQRDMLLRQALELSEKLERLENLPKEPTTSDEDGANVVFFKKRFRSSPTWYTYAAVQTDQTRNNQKLWYTTGPRSPKAYTWEELMEWLYSEGEVDAVWQATAYDRVDETS